MEAASWTGRRKRSGEVLTRAEISEASEARAARASEMHAVRVVRRVKASWDEVGRVALEVGWVAGREGRRLDSSDVEAKEVYRPSVKWKMMQFSGSGRCQSSSWHGHVSRAKCTTLAKEVYRGANVVERA